MLFLQIAMVYEIELLFLPPFVGMGCVYLQLAACIHCGELPSELG